MNSLETDIIDDVITEENKAGSAEICIGVYKFICNNLPHVKKTDVDAYLKLKGINTIDFYDSRVPDWPNGRH